MVSACRDLVDGGQRKAEEMRQGGRPRGAWPDQFVPGAGQLTQTVTDIYLSLIQVEAAPLTHSSSNSKQLNKKLSLLSTSRVHSAAGDIMAGEKSKILVIGATGYIGRHIVAASARLGHPTSALVREPAPSDDPAKAQLLKGFQESGVTLVQGDLYDHSNLVSAIKSADVVVSTVGPLQIADQTKIIDAIKEAGNVKRFFPSEFGLDVDRTGAVEPARSIFAGKAAIRRAVEASSVPYTYVVTGYFAGYGLPSIGQALSRAPPTDKAVVLGDGDTETGYVEEGDIGTYTVLAADDPRAANKTLYVRPPANTLTHNQLLSLWEEKTGKAFERVYLPEDAILKQIQESPIPLNIILAIAHAMYVRGEHNGFEIDPAKGVEAHELFPDVKYTTVDEYLNRLL